MGCRVGLAQGSDVFPSQREAEASRNSRNCWALGLSRLKVSMMQRGVCIETWEVPQQDPRSYRGIRARFSPGEEFPRATAGWRLVLKGEEATRQRAEDNWLQHLYVLDHLPSTFSGYL